MAYRDDGSASSTAEELEVKDPAKKTEEEGFEPPSRLPVNLISSQTHSAALPLFLKILYDTTTDRIFCSGLGRSPGPVGLFSIFRTTSMPEVTSPKMVCLP